MNGQVFHIHWQQGLVAVLTELGECSTIKRIGVEWVTVDTLADKQPVAPNVFYANACRQGLLNVS